MDALFFLCGSEGSGKGAMREKYGKYIEIY